MVTPLQTMMPTKALSGFARPVQLHVRLVSGIEGEIIEDWLVQGGARNAKAKPGRPKDADVTVRGAGLPELLAFWLTLTAAPDIPVRGIGSDRVFARLEPRGG